MKSSTDREKRKGKMKTNGKEKAAEETAKKKKEKN